MAIFTSEQWLRRPLPEVFAFFSDAKNLGNLSPPWLRFEILTSQPIVMGVGSVVDYRIHFHGLPLRWRARIVEWRPPFQFRDEQLRGPFRRWLHTHTFTDSEQGTCCRDEVDYAVWGGRIVDRWFVQRDIERIFSYRKAALLAQFDQSSQS